MFKDKKKMLKNDKYNVYFDKTYVMWGRIIYQIRVVRIIFFFKWLARMSSLFFVQVQTLHIIKVTCSWSSYIVFFWLFFRFLKCCYFCFVSPKLIGLHYEMNTSGNYFCMTVLVAMFVVRYD